MITWLTSGVGIASAAGATVVTSVIVVYTTVGERWFPPQPPSAVETQTQAPAPDTPILSAPAPDVPSAPLSSEVAASAPQGTPQTTLPGFDLVRIEADRTAVIAGTAEPGQEVRILMGSDQIETVTADDKGNFVALTQLPDSETPQAVRLEQMSASGVPQQSSDTVLVMPSNNNREIAPKVVVASVTGISLLQPGPEQSIEPTVSTAPQPEREPAAQIASPTGTTLQETAVSEATTQPAEVPSAAVQALSLDAISYDSDGEVLIAGRSSSEQFVRVYLDNQPVETESVPADGNWEIRLSEIEAGVYTLRVDELDAAGAVTSRVESPFKRETPQAVAQAALEDPLRVSVTVQPGHTLWALADENFGDGLRYVQIFEANRDRIKNPNLIYPGQVFDLPNR